jgi:hypothetical protein
METNSFAHQPIEWHKINGNDIYAYLEFPDLALGATLKTADRRMGCWTNKLVSKLQFMKAPPTLQFS